VNIRLKTESESTLTSAEDNTKALANHFENNIFSIQSSYRKETVEQLEQSPINLDLGLPPTLGEFKATISQMVSGKSLGVSSTPIEAFKAMDKKILAFEAVHVVVLKVLAKKGTYPTERTGEEQPFSKSSPK
jgi:hypothetical protein